MYKTIKDGGYVVGAHNNFDISGKDILLRLNKFGDTLWTKSLGISGYQILCVQETFDKGLVMTSSNYVAKRDSLGNLKWKTLGIGNPNFRWVIQTADSGFVASGGVVNSPLLTKFDKNGNISWSKSYIGANAFYSVQQTSDAGYIAVGGDSIISVNKTNSNGDTLWTRSFITTNRKPLYCAFSITKTPDGGYAFVGTKSENYVWVVKMGVLGNIQWEKEYRAPNIGNGSIRGEFIETTKDGGFIIFGNSQVPSTSPFFYLIKTDAAGNSYSDKIEGYVYNDLNGNCIKDAGEPKLANKMVYISPGNSYATTDTNGFYSVTTDTGTFSVSLVPITYSNQICPNSPSTYSVHFDTLQQNSSANNFGMQFVPNVQDLKISVACGIAKVGSKHKIDIQYENVGTKTMSGNIKLQYDPLLSFVSASPLQVNQNGDTLDWNFSNLLMGEKRNISVDYNVPANPGLVGSTLHHKALIYPLAMDIVSANNIDTTNRIIKAAYDPNFKEVSPKGIGSVGTINLTDSILSYTIHFQNTGTDTAINIVVRDTITSKLNISSIEAGASSHKYTYRVYDSRILEFTFPKIMLPDSTTNEVESHAFVKFKIKQNAANHPGDVIKNKVDIWFDFNAPVSTKKAINTISITVGITQITYNNNIKVNVYPNPFNESTTFIISEQNKTTNGYNFMVFDIYGREVRKFQTASNSFEFIRDELNAGIYIYRILSKDNSLISTGKIIIID